MHVLVAGFLGYGKGSKSSAGRPPEDAEQTRRLLDAQLIPASDYMPAPKFMTPAEYLERKNHGQ